MQRSKQETKSVVEQDNTPMYCSNGVIQICKMFRKKKQQPIYIKQQQQYYQAISEIKDEKDIKQHIQNVSQYFNGYYLMSKTLEEILKAEDLFNNVGDKKVIKVIIKSAIISNSECFIRNSIWRPNQMDALIGLIKKNIQELIQDLRIQKIYKEDLDHLYSMKKFFQSQQQVCQIYARIGEVVESKEDGFIDKYSVKKLYSGFLTNYYQQLYHQGQNKLIVQKLKLLIKFINYQSPDVHTSLLALNPKSKMHFLKKWEGYIKIEKFFEENDIKEIQRQKNYYNEYVHSQVQIIKSSSSQSDRIPPYDR